MTRFLKLIRHQDGKWKALPAETDDLTPVTIKDVDNAPIDPCHLLNALDTLLSSEGGIRSKEEVIRLSSLMKKFSKKLVSRCVYCNVLQASEPAILSDYLDKGGWETIYLWLQESKESNCHSFLLEMLRLCKMLPMTVSRLKENNTAKIVKSLTKHENADVKSISSELVIKWMTIIKEAKVVDNTSAKKKKKSKVDKTVKVEKEEKEEKPIVKAEIDSPKSPARLKSHKRSSSEKDMRKVEYYEDVKIDPEPLLPVPKKPRTDRPKTAKLYQKKFRATGLEEETPLPKDISKKAPTVNKNAAAAAAKKEVAKILTFSVPERIHEKKIKPENLVPVTETTVPNKSIKIIPAKPRPVHIIQESASFMDALISQPVAPIKKKKKIPNKNATSPTSPTTSSPSPTMAPTKLEFYKDTLEMNDESEVKKEDSSESTSAEEKTSSPSENADEPMDTTTGEEGGHTPPNEDSTSLSSSVPETANEIKEEEESSDPAQLRSILAHGKRRGKKKSVRWVEESDLQEVFYFEMDDTERVNVLKSQNFGDLKSIEVKREREAFEAAKRHAGDRMEEMIPWWPVPILIDVPPPLIEPGFQSKEKEIQRIRQQSTLQEIYFTREMVPESPHEPDLEIVAVQEPKVIPLEEENSTGSIIDYSSFELATKPILPEVLTSLMKIPTNRPTLLPTQNISQDQVPVDINILNHAPHNPNIMQQQNHLPMAAPFDPNDPVSMAPNNPALLGMPPPMLNMYNMPPGPDAENNAPSEWRTLEMIQQQEQHQQQFFPPGFPMNPHMPGMNERMPGMNERMPGMNERMPGMNERMPGMNERMPVMNERMPGMNERMPGMNERMPGMNERMPGMNERMPGMNERMPMINERMPVRNEHMQGMNERMQGMNNHMPGMNMRPRMMQEMYRPWMQKGPMHHMGPPRGRGMLRTIPCRHFTANGCRFGNECNFLHLGVNRPSL